ncbi:Uncharacterized protein TPAR_08018 [Tolypocladium paradoxum]|uniref:Uncharacterized protein n=1 Tax=Tolypocladium paradoxum TaxID=94208 RepID=A0A2S4KNK0_9HYPO|nr:Uncharacterized protein TPAR_08018 [Tolypocladium paradoxum]
MVEIGVGHGSHWPVAVGRHVGAANQGPCCHRECTEEPGAESQQQNPTNLTQRPGTLGIFTLLPPARAPGFDSPKQLAKVPLHPVMDTTRDGQENPRLPSSSALEELFDKFFDWPAFSGGPHQPLDRPSHYPSPPSPDSLSSLITGYTPSIIGANHLSIEDLETEFLRMKAHNDEAVTGSDYSGQNPPELVQGGSTSPSDHSGSLLSEESEENQHRPDVSLREAQAQDDEWTYPQTESSKAAPRGYPPRIHVHGDKQGSQPASQSAGQKRRRSGNDAEKRQRQLADPVQTADVRKSGACLPCRVTKTRDGKAEEQLCSCARQYIGKPREISIFLTKDTNSPSLRATVQAYTSNDDLEETGNPKKADFPRDHVPSHETLQSWVEGQIRREHTADFPQALQSFLLAYSEGGRDLPKHGLVENVHKMSCFFRIWRMSSFWCRDPANHIVNLPLSVQARLRNIAREALKLFEYKVLKGLDECLGQHAQPQPQERMAIWASLWQLILMYRDLLTAFKAQITRNTRDGNESRHDVESYTLPYKLLADTHFPLVAIFYHYQFRTKKSLELSLDWLETGPYLRQAPKKKAELRRIGQQLLDARKEASIDQSLQSSKNDSDCLLCVLVVNHELKKLNARKRAAKGGSKSKGSKNSGADDCDDAGE